MKWVKRKIFIVFTDGTLLRDHKKCKEVCRNFQIHLFISEAFTPFLPAQIIFRSIFFFFCFCFFVLCHFALLQKILGGEVVAGSFL